MSTTSKAFLSLGSNLGRRLAQLRAAVRRLNDTDGIDVAMVSPVYESEAHTRGAVTEMPDFLNLALMLETDLQPEQLLDACLSVESAAGRNRELGTWTPRSIDIDILLFADRAIDSERLKVPHPRMAERLFVLLPLEDLDPGAWVPEPFLTSVSELRRACGDSQRIDKRYPADAVFAPGGRPA